MDKQKIAKLTRYRRAVRAAQRANEALQIARATWSDADWDRYFRLEKERMKALFRATQKRYEEVKISWQEEPHDDSLPSPVLR